MADYIKAEVRAFNVAYLGAQLTGDIVNAMHSRGPGGSVYMDAVRGHIAEVRAQLATIEEALGLTEAAPETEAA